MRALAVQSSGGDALLSRQTLALVDALWEPAWLVDAHTLRVLAINAPALALLGRKREQVVGQLAEALLETPEDLAFWAALPAAGADTELLSRTLLLQSDGEPLHVERRIHRLDMPGEPGLLVVSLRDLTPERRALDERDTLIAELRATLESTADGLLVTDLDGRIRAFNRRFTQLWKLPDHLAGGHDESVYAWMLDSVLDPEPYQRQLQAIERGALVPATDRIHLRSGQVLERVMHTQWSRGRPIGRVWSFRDLSERLAADQRIETLSTIDTLTGVPNRRQLTQKLAAAIADAQRRHGRLALLLLDVDAFKQINDSLGQGIGDRVLVEVSQRIRHALRGGDLVGRVGGDQFAVLVHHAGAEAAEHAARRVLRATEAPYEIEGAQFTLTCSIGVALFPDAADSAHDLLRRAETAMQAAKAGGRAGFRFHHANTHDDEVRKRVRLDHAMRQALAQHRFRLHYQPQLDLASGRVVGTEALIRWKDAHYGDISPADFIPVAEASGFIVQIGDWVLGEAVAQAAEWHRAGRELPVSINVSALQFQQSGFVTRVSRALDQAGLPPALLELELTESILVRDAAEALERLQALAALGVRLAIDDFGTGYSSLAYLKRFPIDALKIDRRFVRGLPDDESDAAIVRAIVQMAHALGLRVVAEGVELPAQRDFLAGIGCNMYQGFLFAPALDPQALLARLPALPPPGP